jgi:hypothetical protein
VLGKRYWGKSVVLLLQGGDEIWHQLFRGLAAYEEHWVSLSLPKGKGSASTFRSMWPKVQSLALRKLCRNSLLIPFNGHHRFVCRLHPSSPGKVNDLEANGFSLQWELNYVLLMLPRWKEEGMKIADERVDMIACGLGLPLFLGSIFSQEEQEDHITST